jgi:hypothetical protein
MYRRCRCGLLNWSLTALLGCTSPATTSDEAVDKQPSSVPANHEAPPPRVAKPAVAGESGTEPITLQFVNGPPGLVVSCTDCPGLTSSNISVDKFPAITAPMGATISIQLSALGYMSQLRTITLDSAHVEVPAELQPLN